MATNIACIFYMCMGDENEAMDTHIPLGGAVDEGIEGTAAV